MKVKTLVLNAEGEPHFQSEDQFNIENLFEIAKTREQICRDHGADFTAGAVSFYGGDLVKAVNTGEHAEVSKAIMQILLAAWVYDSLFCGTTKAHYLESDMEFTIADNGAVMHTRVPFGAKKVASFQ